MANPPIINHIEKDRELAKAAKEPPRSTALNAASVAPTVNLDSVGAVCKAAPEGAVIVVQSEALTGHVARHRPDCQVRVKPSLEAEALWRIPGDG